MRIRIIKAKTMTQQKKKRVAAYVRVSTDSMEQEGSLVNQSTYYESFLGNNPDYEFVGIYSDQGISGYEERRPGFQKMIEDARDGKIVCKKYRDRTEIFQGIKAVWCRYLF